MTNQIVTINKNWLLLDACVVAEIYDLAEAEETDKIKEWLSPLLNYLKPVSLSINPLVRVEFLRKFKKRTDFNEAKNYLEKYFSEIPFHSEDDKNDIYKLAAELGAVYQWCYKKQKNTSKHKPADGNISETDLLNATILRRYPRNTYLLTMDCYDYLEPIMIREKYGCYSRGGVNSSMKIWVLYHYSKDGFEKIYKLYNDITGAR